jgi:protocatechuate 3,4-dioxygenase beta subunit
MDNDHRAFRKILSRRDALKLLGIGSAAFLAAYATPGTMITAARPTPNPALDCIVRPELELGPYFVDDQLKRSDIRYDPLEGNVSEGIPLALRIGVRDVSSKSCKPLEGARVDIWHCDAMGIYSGVRQPAYNTTGQKFLRGYQITDSKGIVNFQTIYPGWHSGRAVHIHFTIRTRGTNGLNYQFTSQLFFEDTLTDQVHAQKPYAIKGKRDTRNKKDRIFKDGGDQWVLNVHGSLSGEYRTSISIALDLNDTKAGAPDLYGLPGTKPPY